MSMWHLCKILALRRPFLTKSSFEQHANEGGVSINAYRTNNGCFADAGFQKSIKEANQSILPFAQLVRIIKMGLLSGASRN
jgi:hypothetical protein